MQITPGLRRAGAAALLVLALGATTGCKSGDDADADPAARLAEAQQTLDDTSGLKITLSTPGLPDSVQNGIFMATVLVTNAPAFEGDLSVKYGGLLVDVPVVSTGGVVYAQLPFTSGYQAVNPKEYGAPDPAALISASNGFSSLLPATQEVKEGKSVRGGVNNKEVLTTFTGTVPGAAMNKVIPSAAGQDFAASYLITDEGELREATFKGVFYAKSDPMTYVVEFEDYGTTKSIEKPAGAK